MSLISEYLERRAHDARRAEIHFAIRENLAAIRGDAKKLARSIAAMSAAKIRNDQRLKNARARTAAGVRIAMDAVKTTLERKPEIVLGTALGLGLIVGIISPALRPRHADLLARQPCVSIRL